MYMYMYIYAYQCDGQFVIFLAIHSRKPTVRPFRLVSMLRIRLIFLCGGSWFLHPVHAGLDLHRFYLLFHLSSSLNSS